MKTPQEMWILIKNKIKKQWKTAFLAAFVLGLCIHMPVMVSDIPNHDGLDSIYFDQNMITSGRWFLSVACGLSSYYSLPWVIGLLGMVFLGITAAVLTEYLELENSLTVILVSGLLVAFPALASTFAYVFTLDGYMLGLLLAVSACLCVKKWKYGFVTGGICLAFSMGTYQAYLPVAMLLCVYALINIFMGEGNVRSKVKEGLRYLYMGIIGVGLYYGILQLLLRIQGKELADYQGISGMAAGAGKGLGSTVIEMYRNFGAFTLKGNVFWNNLFSGAALCLLVIAVLLVAAALIKERKWWKSPLFFVIIALTALLVPLVCNVILVISPDVNYHLMMRYQWVLLLILPIAFVDKYAPRTASGVGAGWCILIAGAVLLLNYAVTDNIAYSNLQKKYEKTYAYCLRILDRIESTPGYYPGIPVALMGMVSDEQYPITDVTGDVTSGMIGMGGDTLLYTGVNYQAFIKHYLGATLNLLPTSDMAEIYFTEEYTNMESFPGAEGVKLVDGIIYVKTENFNR